MPFGFSSLDYILFAACLVYVGHELMTKPVRLLYGLPFILTVYVIVPFATLLSPRQVVPLIILGWIAVNANLRELRKYSDLFLVAALVVGVSFCASMLVGDAGTRPIMRLLHYLTLGSIFAFTVWACRTPKALNMAFWGLAICAGIHAVYSIYQIFAFEVDLPFRAIVRDTGGRFSAPASYGLYRVNGLVDEPKRLGYVLFVGAIAAFHLSRGPTNRLLLRAGAVVSLAVSLITLSTSYFAAACSSLFFISLSSGRVWRYIPAVLIGAVLIPIVIPGVAEPAWEALSSAVNTRLEEVTEGLDADRIYRQEFFAQDLVENAPFTLVTGLGLGRYYTVLQDAYGFGAGLTVRGRLLPLNSQIFEIGFDLGICGLLLFYAGSLRLVYSIGDRSDLAFCVRLMCLVVVIQSIFIQSLYLAMFVLGMAAAYVRMKNRMHFAPTVRTKAKSRRSRASPIRL